MSRADEPGGDGMTWHSVTVPCDELNLLVVAIAWGGGTITSSSPCPDGVCVTYVSEQPVSLPAQSIQR